jgi:hypothetical protein
MIENTFDRLPSELAKQDVPDSDLRDSIVRSPTGELAVTGQMLLEGLSYTHLELPIVIEGDLEGAV